MGFLKIFYQILVIISIIGISITAYFDFNKWMFVIGTIGILCQLSVIEIIISEALKD